MSGIRVNEWLHNSGTGGIWQTSAGNVGIASSVPTAKLVVTGDVNVSGALTATNFNGGQLGNRNLIINGAMQVAQRATTSTTSGYASLDRMRVQFVGHDEAMTHAQHALTSSDTGPWAEGFRHSLHITNGNQTGGAGAGDYSRLEYNIEAQDMASCGWDYTSPASHLTLTYWVKSSVAQNFHNYMRAPDGTAQGYSWETGTLTADTWKKVTKTIPGNANLTFDNDANTGLALSFSLFFGTNFTDSGNTMNAWAAYASANRMPDNTSTWYTTNDSTYEITGIQLEVGSVATPFEHRSYADELLRCQRYYQVVVRGADYGSGIAPICNVIGYQANNAFGVHHLPVTMRTEPTLDAVTGTAYWKVFRNAGNGDFNSIQLDQCSNSHIELNFYGVSSGTSIAQDQPGWARSNDSSAFIGITAEL